MDSREESMDADVRAKDTVGASADQRTIFNTANQAAGIPKSKTPDTGMASWVRSRFTASRQKKPFYDSPHKGPGMP